jgi:transcriptional regulator with XRE-family HTH domain
MTSGFSALSGEQIRAARALARIDQSELARRCGLSLETIKRLERIRGPVDANSRTLRALIDAFSAIGVAFDGCEESVGVCFSAGVASHPTPRISRASGSTRKADRRSGDAELHRLIYHSAANPQHHANMHELLEHVRVAGAQREATMEVTGVLFARSGRFLSVLEGPKDSVRQVYGAISCDRRHASLTVISDQPAPSRRFLDWTVCCGLFESDTAIVKDEPALIDGFHPHTLSPASALGLLSVMRDLKEAPPRKDLKSLCPCPLAAVCKDLVCAGKAASAGAAPL